MNKIKSLIKVNFVYKFLQVFSKKEYKLFLVTCFYLVSLYFSTNNRVFLLLTCVYFLVVYKITFRLKESLLLVFIVLLPFAKGKAIEILMLPKEQVQRYIIFKISYFFPVYISILPLGLLYYLHFRKILTGNNKYVLTNKVVLASGVFLLFILSCLLALSFNVFPEVILFSAIQLFILLLIMLIPFITFHAKKNNLENLYIILTTSVLFHSIWVLMQRLNNGPLGKDIEVNISGNEFGIQAAEHIGLLRTNGIFYDPSILSTYLIMHIVLFTYILVFKKIKLNKFIRGILVTSVLTASIALGFAGNRAIYLLYAIFILLVLYIKKFNIARTLKLFNKAIIIVVIIIFPLISYIFNRFASFPEIFSYYGSASYRLDMMKYALRLGFLFPFGVGLNLSPYYLATAFPYEKFVFDPTYPHSLFFQIFAETGIVGLFLFLIFLYLIFRDDIYLLFNRLITSKHIDGVNNFININEFGLAAIIFLICAQVYPIFLNHQEVLSFFFLYIGFYIYERNIN